MAEKTIFKYDAFISYRHSEIDKFIAENLHKRLESYRLPRKLDASLVNGERRIKRVFRDEEELPLATNLEDPIIAALENTDWLIVICTPRLNQSEWCKKEIATFIEMHGRERVLLALCEGEPDDSFPELMRFKEEKVANYDGSFTTKRIPLEPLAADFRGETKKEILKKMDVEIFRLLSRMYNVNFDDLRRRHHEREVKRRLAVATTAASLGLITGAVGLGTAAYISQQNNLISEQNTQLAEQQIQLIKNQSVSYAEIAKFEAETDPMKALELAYYSATEADGITMEYTSEARRLMTNLLHLYDSGSSYKLKASVSVDGSFSHLYKSANLQYFAIYTVNKTCFIYNTHTQTPVYTFSNIQDDDCISFCGDSYLFCGTKEEGSWGGFNKIQRYNLANGKIDEIECTGYGLAVNEELGLLYAITGDSVLFYDAETLSVAYSYNFDNYSTDVNWTSLISTDKYMLFTDGDIMRFNDDDGNRVEDTFSLTCENTLFVVDIETGDVLYNTHVDGFRLKDARVIDGVILATLVNNGTNTTGNTLLAIADSSLLPVAPTPEITPVPTPEVIEDEIEDTEDDEITDDDITEDVDEITDEENPEEEPSSEEIIPEEVIIPEVPVAPTYPMGELWRVHDEGVGINYVVTDTVNTPDEICYVSRSEVRSRNIHTGEIILSAICSSDVKAVALQENRYIAFLKDGSAQVIVKNALSDPITVTWFNSNTISADIVVANNSIFVFCERFNMFYIFSKTSSPNIEVIDGEPTKATFFNSGTEYTIYGSDDFSAECEKYDVDPAEAYNLIYSLDNKICFINFNNATVSLYDAKSKELIVNVHNETGFYFTACAQNEYYYIIGSYSVSSYLIDKETLEIVAEIESVTAIDDDYIYISDSFYMLGYDNPDDYTFARIPIYSAEEVLELAEEALAEKD